VGNCEGKGNLVNKKHVGDTACLCLQLNRFSDVVTVIAMVNKPVCVRRDIFLGRRYLCKSEPERRVGFRLNKYNVIPAEPL
jgi:hypothetical protein